MSETLTVDFAAEQRHGIYRDIPLHMNDSLGQHFKMRLTVREVTDAAGRPRPFRLERQGRSIRIRVGDADTFVSGRQAYRIVYEVRRGAVRFFPDHEECYWNFTGHEWSVWIRKARAQIKVPDQAAGLRAVGYAGVYGSRTLLRPGIQGKVVSFEAPGPMAPYEGITGAVAWESGGVLRPSFARLLLWWGEDNWIYAIPVLIFIAMFCLWRAKGRDPRTGKSLTVGYEPPAGLAPAEMGTLADQRADLRDITATVVDLAVRGYLKMEPLEKLLWGKRDYLFTNLKNWNGDAGPKAFEREILRGIFGEPGASVKLSDLEEDFYRHLPDIRKFLYRDLTAAGYFEGDPDRVRTAYLTGGCLLGGVLAWAFFVTLPLHFFAPAALISVSAISGLIVFGFGFLMPRRTFKGANLMDQAAGFLEFLKRADGDRIRRINDPGLFERGLPYALAFGLAGQWARAFEGIYTEPPSWYAGRWDTFSPRGLGRDLNQTMSSMGQTFASQPRSSSSSGFGGGGFSGGGSGGGGGGAW